MTETASFKLDKFLGLKGQNPIVSLNQGTISAKQMKNTEIRNSGKGNSIGIYTQKGRVKIAGIEGKTIIHFWTSVQSGVSYIFVYATDSNNGYLYYFNPLNHSFELIKTDLTKTDKANALTFAQGFHDYFFFTNGIDAPFTVQMTSNPKVVNINATDTLGRQIRGLSLEQYDGRIAMSSKNRIHWSKQGDIFTWNDGSSTLTASAYQEFDRDVTACIYYNNSLIVFTEDYSVSFSGNPADSSTFVKTGATGGGASSPFAVLKIANKVFYYDHKARNLFSYYLYDTGQIRPSNGLADAVFEYLSEVSDDRVKEIAIFPLIFSDKNEIWFKLPSENGGKIIILDYLKNEWITREGEGFSSALVLKNELISAFSDGIYKEYLTSTFAGKFSPSEYQFYVLNFGSDASTKMIKGGIYLTLDASYHNDFYIEFIFDDNSERRLLKRVSKKYGINSVIFSDEDNDISKGFFIDDDTDISGGTMINDYSYDVLFKLSETLSFRQLQIRIFTKEAPQDFGIKAIEFARIKIKPAR